MTDEIDWPGIRANAVHVGVREAARQAGADLSPIEQNRFVERVMKRSGREGWIQHLAEAKAAAAISPASSLPLSASVRTGADSASIALAEASKETKANLVKAAGNAAKVFASRTGSKVIESAQALRHITAAASTLHGWEEKKDAGLTLQLGISVGGMQ
jgi:hypothetical protein